MRISAKDAIVRSTVFASLVACGGAPRADAPARVPAPASPPLPGPVLDAVRASAEVVAPQPESAVEPQRREEHPKVPSTRCPAPSRLVQGGTVHDNASFRGEVLASGWSADFGREEHSYDPETLRPGPPLPPEPIDDDESGFVSLAGGFRVESGDGDVTEVATGRVVLHLEHPCAAGGFITYSLSNTGRYLRCDSNRVGLALWDLRSPRPGPDRPPSFAGAGLRLSPDDAYAVDLPVFPFAMDRPSRDTVLYYNLGRRSSRTLSSAPALDHDNPYDLAFCGDGSIFAVSGEHELTIYRGSDGQRLAGAPAKKGGEISFSASGRYVSQSRSGWTTVYRLLR